MVVCKVIDVDESAQQVDLSIKDVNDHQRSDKIQDWKNDQKADKWMEIAFGEGIEDDDFRRIANELIDKHGSLYAGFEQAAIHGSEALESTDLDDGEIDSLVEAARENVSVPYVTVTGYVDLEAPGGTGVEDVREALKAASGNGEIPEEIDLEVTYVGSPEYRIRVQAPNYKAAENELEAGAARARETIESLGGSADFHRERRTDEE